MSAIDMLGIGARKSDHDAVVAALFGGKTKASRPIKSLSEELDRLRLIKSPSEIKLMRAAGEAASLAHADAMAFAEPDMTEAVLCARFEYQCALAGAERLAYVPVCASGPSALTMHYTANDRPLQRGSLVLFDAGCERHGYASDITRTFPVDGTFSSAQRDLYEALLTVQKACVALCAAGEGVSLQDLHRRSFGLLRRELIRLGFDLPTGALERTLHPHFIGHQLGMDLHDVRSTSRHERSVAGPSLRLRTCRLKPGMVITIEPGILCVAAHVCRATAGADRSRRAAPRSCSPRIC